MSHFFFLLLWNSEFLYESAVVSLSIRYDSFWYAVHLLSSDVFLINAVFCGHNIAGINGSKVSFTESLVLFTDQQCHLQIRLLQLLVRDAQCSLQICGVIYQSPGVKYWFAEKNLNAQNRTKKGSKPKIFLLVHLVTMT